MTFQEIYDFYKNQPIDQKYVTITEHFNGMKVEDRRAYIEFLGELPDGNKEIEWLTKILRDQAVKDFWNHERELIKDGIGTREWTLEQMEAIFNIGELGNESKYAGAAIQFDINGLPIKDPNKKTVYYGHHMLDVATYPEFAGDFRNVQALDYQEHY